MPRPSIKDIARDMLEKAVSKEEDIAMYDLIHEFIIHKLSDISDKQAQELIQKTKNYTDSIKGWGSVHQESASDKYIVAMCDMIDMLM